ncbi:hypothetical protein ACWCYY_40255 [Kitasatospora sp. NPDC001664]|uniref:hypothetical protein n=1 Tax=Kitasatospora albolonga TaxID=68173 RepID=UPI0035EC75BD
MGETASAKGTEGDVGRLGVTMAWGGAAGVVAGAWLSLRFGAPVFGWCLAGGHGAAFLLLTTDRVVRRWGWWPAVVFGFFWTFWWPGRLVVEAVVRALGALFGALLKGF